MNIITQRTNRRAGSAMILALTMVAVVATATATAYFYSASQVTAGKKTISFLKARSIAESGLTIAYGQMKASPALITNGTTWAWTSFDGGQYMVTPKMVTPTNIILNAVGQFNHETAQARMDLHYYPATPGGGGNGGGGSSGSLYGPYIFTNVLYVGGNCSWSGSAAFDGGCAFVNGTLGMSGSCSWGNTTSTLVIASAQPMSFSGSVTLNANTVMTPSITMSGSGQINANTVVLSTPTAYSLNGSARINGTKVAGTVPVQAIPSIEMSPYYQIACTNHEVYTNFSHSGAYSPVGGVLWNVGTLKFSGSGTSKGCFISTSGINLSGSMNFSPSTTSWPTLYNQAGDISVSGSGDIQGLIYSGGTVSFSGSGNIVGGPLISASTFSKTGSGGLTLGIPISGFVVTTPLVNAQQSTPSSAMSLVVTGWQ